MKIEIHANRQLEYVDEHDGVYEILNTFCPFCGEPVKIIHSQYGEKLREACKHLRFVNFGGWMEFYKSPSLKETS